MESWAVTASCGGRFPGIDPVFFGDRVAVACALAIKVFQLSTRQLVAKINVDMSDAAQLLLATGGHEFLLVRRCGSIERIPFDEIAEIVRLPSSVRVRRLLNERIALVHNARGQLEIGHINLTEDVKFDSLFESQLANGETGLAAFSNGLEYAAFTSPRAGKVELVDLTTWQCVTLPTANRSTATSLAVSGSGIVAVGNQSGVIDMLYPHSSKATRALKWHLEPVQALTFAQHDEYLLSGGHERVLVFWQLSTNRQQFLPRLSGPITRISAHGGLYALTLGGTHLVVISAVDLVSRLQVSGTRARFEKVVPDHQAARRRRRKRNLDMWAAADYTASMQVHPGTREVYLVGDAAAAQVYSLVRDEQVGVVQLAPVLDAGKVRNELELLDPVIEILRFSSCGRFMLTCDRGQTPQGLLSSQSLTYNLRFWHRKESGEWAVTTRVENPHGQDTEIVDASFSTVGDAVTAGSDGSVRLWRISSGGARLARVSAGFGSKSPAVSVAFSADRSVLALAYETSVFLLDGNLRVVKQVPNVAGALIRALRFAKHSLLILDKTRLSVFDIVKWTLRYSMELRNARHGARLLATDPALPTFALAVNYWTPQYRVHSKVLHMSTKSAIPLSAFVHPYAVGALAGLPGTHAFCFIDQRGVLNTVAALPPDQQAEPTVGVASTSLVSLCAAPAPAPAPVEGHARSLDVSAVSKVFDPSAGVEQLFDSVLRLVSI